jgi:hypothetical protein
MSEFYQRIAPTFRLLAIAEDMDGIDRVVEFATQNDDLPLGLMIRDRSHDGFRTAALCYYSSWKGAAQVATVVSNGFRSDWASYTHVPASMVDSLYKACAIGMYQDSYGGSAHSLEEAEKAVAIKAAYITLSPIFPTSSKPGHPGIGIEALRSIAATLPIPIYALGGMNNLEAVRAALDAGAYGIASISLFAPEAASELERVTRYLRNRE